MAISVKDINKISIEVADETGDYLIGMWVTSDDTGPEPVYIEETQNTGSTSPASAVDQCLTANGYEP